MQPAELAKTLGGVAAAALRVGSHHGRLETRPPPLRVRRSRCSDLQLCSLRGYTQNQPLDHQKRHLVEITGREHLVRLVVERVLQVVATQPEEARLPPR